MWLKKLENAECQDYREYLESDHWQSFKKWTLTQEFYKTCLVCNSSYGINLHHFKYLHLVKNQALGVVPVCRKHHQQIHDIKKTEDISLRKATKKVVGSIGREMKRYLKLLNKDWMKCKYGD